MGDCKECEGYREALLGMLPRPDFKECFTKSEVLDAVKSVRGYYHERIEAALHKRRKSERRLLPEDPCILKLPAPAGNRRTTVDRRDGK